MNIFSQSKLTLKLKKSNSLLSSTTTKELQKPEISDSLKSEYLLNNSIVSENDSFVEILHTIQTDGETKSQSIFKKCSNENMSNVINENKRCPICSIITDGKHFINHVKSCGMSHNLSSEILLKAVDLEERQTAEREALGLPILTKSKNKKKIKNSNQKLKTGIDSNLDLAIAMSMSLQESKEEEIIKESESLLEAGLEKEAIEKRKTLESFGFKSNLIANTKNRSFFKTNSLLFKQSEEDREKRITEKIAMVLIESDTDSPSLKIHDSHCPNTNLESKYLNKIRCTDNILWKKSLLEDENMNEFYVNNLSKFIEPQKNYFSGLKNTFIFPVHQNNLAHESKKTNEKYINTLSHVADNPNLENKSLTTTQKIVENITVSEYSSKWKSMIGNQLMSDITIITRNEHEIFVHTLVIMVQCSDILDDVITEESNLYKTKKMIMWTEYSYEACMAFLELIYCGQQSYVGPEHREDYLKLGTRYNVLLLDTSSDETHGWIYNKKEEGLKRKCSELFTIPTDSKRYKASSPDLFVSEDISTQTSTSPNFLGIAVNDEKFLSTIKTKQWLYNCHRSQHHNLSFTENLNNIPQQTILPEATPCHSFHSASTVSLPSPRSNHDNDIMNLENNNANIYSSLDINNLSPISSKSSLKATLIENVSTSVVNPSIKMQTLTNVCKKPELIIINSDSDSDSIDIIIPSNLKKSNNGNTILNIDLLNENSNSPLFQSSIKNEKSNISFNSNNNKCKYNTTNTIIELNDNSLDSIHSAHTNLLYPKYNYKESPYNCFQNSISSLRNKTITNIDDECSIFSTVANVLHLNNSNTQILPSDNNIIDLIEDSSDSISTIDTTNLLKNKSTSTFVYNVKHNYQSPESFSNITSSKRNLFSSQRDSKSNLSPTLSISNNDQTNSTNTNIKINEPFGINSAKNMILLESKDNPMSLVKSQKPLILNNMLLPLPKIAQCTQINDIKKNDYNSDDEKYVSNKSNSDSEPLKNIMTKTSLIKPSINCDDSLKNTNKIFDLSANSSSEYTEKHISVEPIGSTTNNTFNSSNIFDPNENNHGLDSAASPQHIDDPWMDYWQPVNISPQYVTPILSESKSIVSANEFEIQTPKKGKECNINLDLQTPSSILNYSNTINSQKKCAVTPNKYGNRTNTPKTLRRVQSESIIGSKTHITPLPDYSTMKTPDLRKEFDRYGLKDLGRRKGKLILRHIYDELHSIYPLNETKCNTESEQTSDFSDGSEHGIPDYEAENYDELDTLSQTSLSSKTSVEMGFHQLLKVNTDLHTKILCYEPIWIEELKEYLKQYNVTISMQKLMSFLDDKCVTFRSKSLNDQRQKNQTKNRIKRKKLF